jgi:hypothetical protein
MKIAAADAACNTTPGKVPVLSGNFGSDNHAVGGEYLRWLMAGDFRPSLRFARGYSGICGNLSYSSPISTKLK